MNFAPISSDSLRILFLLLPGFVTLLVERSMFFQLKEPMLFSTIKALVYSFLNYAIFSLTGIPVSSRWAAITILIIAAIAGVVIGMCKWKDWHMKLVRKVGLTGRTAGPSIWQDVFHSKYSDSTGAYVIVFLKDGNRIYGWPEYYSDEYNNGPVLFLSKAGWLFNEAGQDKEVEIPNPGILLNGSQIKHIHFYMPDTTGGQNGD
jgi:hypothetical protein